MDEGRCRKCGYLLGVPHGFVFVGGINPRNTVELAEDQGHIVITCRCGYQTEFKPK
jgi:hypothetical protein